MRSSHQTRRHRRRVSVRVLVSRRLCRPPPIGRSHISRAGFRRARPKNRKLTLYFSVRSSIFLYFLAGKKSRFLSTAGDDCSRRENGAAWPRSCGAGRRTRELPPGRHFSTWIEFVPEKNSTARCLQMQLIGARERDRQTSEWHY